MVPLCLAILALYLLSQCLSYSRWITSIWSKLIEWVVDWVDNHPRTVNLTLASIGIYCLGPLPVLGWYGHKFHRSLYDSIVKRWLHYRALVRARVRFIAQQLEDWAKERGDVDGDEPEPYTGVMYFGEIPSDFGGQPGLLVTTPVEDRASDEDLVQQSSAAARVKYGLFERNCVNTKIVDRYIREYLVDRRMPRSRILRVAPVACEVYFRQTATDEACGVTPRGFR